MKQNCWEFKKCGREVGGVNVKKLGICPASTETAANGTHGGKNGGRCCWAIVGTFCVGDSKDTFATKIRNCMNCEFYKLVYKEEIKAFIL